MELVQEFRKTDDISLKSAISDLLSELVECPVWPILEEKSLEADFVFVSRQQINDTSSAQWLSHLKHLMNPDDDEMVDNVLAKARSDSSLLPKLITRLMGKSDQFIKVTNLLFNKIYLVACK